MVAFASLSTTSTERRSNSANVVASLSRMARCPLRRLQSSHGTRPDRSPAVRRNAFNFADASSNGEVGAVGRQEPKLRAHSFDRSAHGGRFVGGEIVEHDDVARCQRRPRTDSTYARSVALSFGRRSLAAQRESRSFRIRLSCASRFCRTVSECGVFWRVFERRGSQQKRPNTDAFSLVFVGCGGGI